MKRNPPLAAAELPTVAEWLRDEAARAPAERGIAAGTMRLAADVLVEVAAGRDPRKLFAPPKGLAPARCVEAVIAAQGCGNWREARRIAAMRLHVDIRTVERHWRAWLLGRGKVEADLIPLAQPAKKRTTRKR